MTKLKTFLWNLCIIFLLLLINKSFTLAQSVSNELFSTNNRKIFGDYLFCEEDYLRAIDEYRMVLKHSWNDTLQYKIGLSYFYMDRYLTAEKSFSKLFQSNSLSSEAKLEYYRAIFYLGDYTVFRERLNNKAYFPITYRSELNRLEAYSYLMDDSDLPEEKEMFSNFDDSDIKSIIEFYSWKNDPPYKSTTKGAIMSAIIPGLGKVYADEVGDGITAFLLTGLLTYIAVDKFQNGHTSSGWLFAALAAFFYGGNIYGSAAAVQNYNASIKFNFDNEVKLYLNRQNHFLPKPKYLCE